MTLAHAGPQPADRVWDSRRSRWLSAAELPALFPRGSVILLGEQHAFDENKTDPGIVRHHRNQVDFLRGLAEIGLPVSVGMEFLLYTHQDATDSFLSGTMSEADFLTTSEWGGADFPSYRDQVLFPARNGGQTRALNIPRNVTRSVAKLGPGGLTPEESALLPPIWERGQALYFERFVDIMGGHGNEAAFENYFWAQSLWDDTMAWNIARHREVRQDDALVVIVGEFHVEYGLGLSARLARYGQTQVVTVVQREVSEAEMSALPTLIAPDPKYGALADYVWYFKTPPTSTRLPR